MESNINETVGFDIRIIDESTTDTKNRVIQHFSSLENECVFYINKSDKLDSFNREDLEDFETFFTSNVKNIVKPVKTFKNGIIEDYITNNPLFILSYNKQL